VEANPAGTGITVSSTSADYAEMLPRLDPEESIVPGHIVGVYGGRITKRTAGADRLMVVTDRPSVLGNVPDPERKEDYEAVAFLGQVPVVVHGPVGRGDYVVASGVADGSGTAIAPENVTLRDAAGIVGRVWDTDEAVAGAGRVILEVGLDRANLLVRLIEHQEKMIARQQTQINQLLERIEADRTAL
jgi:hypothetical protein